MYYNYAVLTPNPPPHQKWKNKNHFVYQIYKNNKKLDRFLPYMVKQAYCFYHIWTVGASPREANSETRRSRIMCHIHILVLSTATGLHSAASSTNKVCSLGFTAMFYKCNRAPVNAVGPGWGGICLEHRHVLVKILIFGTDILIQSRCRHKLILRNVLLYRDKETAVQHVSLNALLFSHSASYKYSS